MGRAGSDLVLQMHYTANGKPHEQQVRHSSRRRKLQVESSLELQADAKLIDLMPHMHLRGKDFEYRAVYPTGETQVLLSVPKYNFNWQLVYYPQEPIVLPKGTRIECTAHFDNSPNNPANPDPTHEVKWGGQSRQEMMIGWIDLAIDADKKPADVYRKKKANPSDD